MGKKKIYHSEKFTISIKQYQSRADFIMNVYGPFINTKDLPHTLSFLEANFPDVLKTECFNDNKLTFKEEVKNTEIAHLFEHIVLEELCNLKIKNGAYKAIHKGQTSWNWHIENQGTFHITIDCCKSENDFLHKAIEKATLLLEALVSEEQFNGQPLELPVESYSVN